MKVEDIKQLQRAWENKIMPLLQEYFYSDYEKLSKVIGDKSEYLKRDGEDWELNMRVKDFDSQFKLVYDFVCGIKEKVISQESDKQNTEKNN